MINEKEYLDILLEYAFKTEGTDIHLCTGSKPLIRIGGKLAEFPGVDRILPNILDPIIDALLDVNQKGRLERNKVLDFSFSKPGIGRFRANIYSQRGSYALAIRRLPFEVPEIGNLSLPKSVVSFVEKSRGLFLVTGPTGSGKSTTLAALINEINKRFSYHIITIEDPIEYLHKHEKSLVTQREIGSDAESFAQALRSALREDPDVIMVGEMRDPETISIALTAAETGHLVFSTLHTVGAAKSIDRIIDAFPPSQHNQIKTQLATVLEGVVTQQLIPRIDRTGLVAAHEVMVANPAIRNLIREGKHYQINSIMQTGQASGMQLMEAELAELVKKGTIDKERVMLHANDPQLFLQFLNRR